MSEDKANFKNPWCYGKHITIKLLGGDILRARFIKTDGFGFYVVDVYSEEIIFIPWTSVEFISLGMKEEKPEIKK